MCVCVLAEMFMCFRPWANSPASATHYCGVGCLDETYSGTEWKITIVITTVLAWMGYIGTGLVFITMLFIPKYPRIRYFCCVCGFVLRRVRCAGTGSCRRAW
jgi:hypothetical protein